MHDKLILHGRVIDDWCSYILTTVVITEQVDQILVTHQSIFLVQGNVDLHIGSGITVCHISVLLRMWLALGADNLKYIIVPKCFQTVKNQAKITNPPKLF